MRRFLILSSILISIFCSAFIFNIIKNKPVILQDGTIEYNLSKQSQIKASRILYKYVLKDLNKTKKTAKDFADITPNSVKAFEYDLNNDGKNEIIGVVYSTFYWGTAGYTLFILEKINNNYVNIAYMLNFEPLKKIYILTKNTNGYKDIKYYGSSAYHFKALTAKFNKQVYYNDEEYNLFQEYLKNFSDYDVSAITGVKE